jgi:hypothetical protein
MAFSKRRVSLKHLLIMFYILTVVLTFILLSRERQIDQASFSFSNASTESHQGFSALSLYGGSFDPDLRGVLARSLVNGEALLWHQSAGIPSKEIDVKNDLALVACYESKLVSMRLRDGKRADFVGSVELPASIRQVKIVGDQALLGLSRHEGLAQIDLKDPTDLKLVRNYPLQGFVADMVVDQNVIYYANIYQGVGRLDLSAQNPTPELLAYLNSSWTLALQGNRLAVGTIKDGVHLFDVTQRGALVEVGRLDYPEVVRGLAFADGSLAVALASGGLHLFDLSSWPNLNSSAQLTLPGSPLELERVPDRAALAVGLIAGGVVLVDISQPMRPILSGHLKLPRTFNSLKIQAGNVFASSLKGIEAFSLDEISAGEYSLLATEATLDLEHYKLQSWNGYVYGYKENRLVPFGAEPIASGSSGRLLAIAEKRGVGLYEQNEKDQVQRAGSLITIEGVKDARFQGEYLYVVHNDGLRIFSGTRPEELVAVGDLKLDGIPREFELLNSGYLLVITGNNEVLVVDVNNPQLPVHVATLAPPQHLRSVNLMQDVLVDGQRAYVSQGAGGVHVYDMSSPSQPELVQIIDTPGQAKKMVLYDNLLLVADRGNGLFMVDVKDLNRSLAIGTLPTPLRVDELAVVGDGLIVSSHPGGTMKLPLPQRLEDLKIVNQGEIRVDVESVEKGQYVYLYDEGAFERAKVAVP